jgi:tetratricopeptide (TPR) repeat protein
VSLLPRRLLSSLELAWGEPRRAWVALSSVRADDSTSAAWRAFGEEAEFMQVWPVARDAWVAVFERRGDLEAQQHAAQTALSAGDAALALSLATRPAPPSAAANPLSRPGAKPDPTRDTATRLRTLLPIEIAALGELGRAKDAQVRLDASMSQLDEPSRAAMARPLVTAWLRAGDLERARAAVKGSDLAEDDETAGWLALYEGDLATARKRLVRADTKRGPLVDALGLLARTRVQQSPSLGLAFLALAQRDSAAASARFVALADSLGEAAPVLLALASRIEAAKATPAANGKTPVPAKALVLWDRIVAQHPKSPEAPEALLASARAYRDSGDNAGAVARFESLLIDYPESALLPQARRDLERLRGQVPPELTAR